MHFYASSPVLAIPQVSGPDFFSPDSDFSSMTCGLILPNPPVRPQRPLRHSASLPCPPSQNYLAKAHFPIAGRKRRSDDADLEEADIRSPVGRQISHPSSFGSRFSDGQTSRSARKIACVGRSTCHQESSDSSLDRLRQYLGISWKPLPPSLAQASNGWVRYIENHFPVTSVSILLYNESWKAYFVRASPKLGFSAGPASEQYYLFQESLMAARPVSNSLEIAIQKISHWSQMLVHGPSWSPLNDPESLVFASQSRHNASPAFDQSRNLPTSAVPEQADVEMC